MLLIKLAWYKTGDSFSIECPNGDSVSWFIEKCHIHGNNFNLSTCIFFTKILNVRRITKWQFIHA